MDEVIDEVIEDQNLGKKVYTNRMFWVGTYLGGPLVAGYFFVENFKAMNQAYKVKTVWFIAVLATIAISIIAFAIPENSNIPNQVIPIAYTVLASSLFKIKQEKEVNELVTKGAEVFSWWRVFGVGILGLLLTLGAYLLIFNALDVFKFML